MSARAVLLPLVAEAARRAGAGSVGLVGLGRTAGLDVLLDRTGVACDDGRRLGDSASPVQVAARVVGRTPVPATAPPPVVARVMLAREPLTLRDASVPPVRDDPVALLPAAEACWPGSAARTADPLPRLARRRDAGP